VQDDEVQSIKEENASLQTQREQLLERTGSLRGALEGASKGADESKDKLERAEERAEKEVWDRVFSTIKALGGAGRGGVAN
jgi:archaellum component FlaC